jgi:prepilin-type N-terminal cleavage/methylation domain-containing protein
MTRSQTRGTAGFTLIELLVSLVVFSIVMASALSFLRSQGRAVSLGNDRMDALQNLSFAMTTMEQRLRAAGGDVPDQQPVLVYAGKDVVAFNADYTTNIANDPFAVYYDPDAPSAAVTAVTQSMGFTIPNTSFTYPSTTYTTGGINSPAETIIFYLRPDSTTSRTDDYILFEQVNNQPAEIVSRNVIGSSSTYFFKYFKVTTPASGATFLDSVPSGSLPLTHSVAVHLALGDTGAYAAIDSVRGVLLSLTVTNGSTGAAERQHTVTRFVSLPNTGLAHRQTCGDIPILGQTIAATEITQPDSTPAVTLTWNPATDENNGEKDVATYVLWRKKTTDATWGNPYLSIPAGSPSYSYTDAAVTSGTSYQYQLAAEDCTPSLSATTTSNVVAIP